MRQTTLDFAHNLPALGRVVARRQAQIREGEFRPDPHHPGWMVRGEAPPGTPPEPPFSEEFLTSLEKAGGNRQDFLDVNLIPGGNGDNVGAVACPDCGSSIRIEFTHNCATGYRWSNRDGVSATSLGRSGSVFARRPDEKGRRRKKRDNPPPPMSDLLGEVPRG